MTSRLLTSAAALAMLCGSLAQALATEPRGWTQYRNDRYGFTLQYPAHAFTLERSAEAGDGQAFVSREGEARLLVGALINEQGHRPASYLDYIARESYADYQIGYKRIGQNWFVLSGEGKGKIFYEKVMFSCANRLINGFAMIYSVEQRHIFDPIVERIEDTFRPGNDCQGAGLPAAAPVTPERPRPRRVTYPSDTVGERSAFADRIARAQGRDVLVIVRRTTPPYDRRVLRGYVSR